MYGIFQKKLIHRILAVILALQLLNACTSTDRNPSPEVTLPLSSPPSAISTQTPTREEIKIPSLTPTVDHYQEWLDWLATRPRDMESYGRVYDPEAKAVLPPSRTVNMFIWDEHLPLQVLDHTPAFIDTPPLLRSEDLTAALAKAGCARDGRSITCAQGSPWLEFGCELYLMPDAGNKGVPPGMLLLAQCLTPEVEGEDRGDYLFRTGCAFRNNVAYIVEEPDGYRLISTLEELQDLWQPIETPEEALTYAVLMTGLSATHHFTAQPELLYFKDPLEGTRVILEDDHYLINLFHYETCLCEPWVNSEVFLSVDRQGELSWLYALPISMTIGFSCAD